jgi:hypothetical protein
VQHERLPTRWNQEKQVLIMTSARDFAEMYAFTFSDSYFYGYGYFGVNRTASVKACTSEA